MRASDVPGQRKGARAPIRKTREGKGKLMRVLGSRYSNHMTPKLLEREFENGSTDVSFGVKKRK